MATGTRTSDPELDGALAKAIRQLIAGAAEAGDLAGGQPGDQGAGHGLDVAGE
jgi:hypothetical protein